MGNSAAYREAHREETAAYMRAYYRAHSIRPVRIPGSERQSKKCRKCGVVKNRDQFTVRKSGERLGHLAGHCKTCSVKVNTDRWNADPERLALIGWRSKIKRRYGLTEAAYNAMLNAQGHACAICRSTVSWSKNYKHKKNGSSRFMVDHCHETGKIRGLLCTRCNRALGLVQDNTETLKRAVEYLNRDK